MPNSNQVLVYQDELEQNENGEKEKRTTHGYCLNQGNDVNQWIDIYENDEAMHFDTDF